jgi:outer membrane protein assembly factor BamB
MTTRPDTSLWTLAALSLALSASAGTVRGAQNQDEEVVESRSFSIPDTRYARSLHERALAHIAAERWTEAIADLQELIEDHRGEVLAATSTDGNGEPSLFPFHTGAADEARAILLALPQRARQLYSDRYGNDARLALADARRRADRRGLVELARRWPLSDSAREAWWTLGDLELELGNPGAAGDAWARARELDELAEAELTPGRARRIAFLEESTVRDLPRDDAVLVPSKVTSSITVPGPGQALGSAPGPDCHSWRQSVEGLDDERVPFSIIHYGENHNLMPVLAGDLLLVSNSLRLYAFDAWTGTRRWVTDEPPGWDRVDSREARALNDNTRIDRTELFEAVDRDSVLIGPAASGGIAVAPLQIPVTLLGSTKYQQIPITRAIPDRRLFAYDLESGRELWNHMPPPLWDGESGSFAERMRVAAPPVIAGSRLVVPTYRMQGRIDYHLACYDLFTGTLLWSTALISGQKPLNMFGRHQEEFSAAPVRIEGDRVIAVTQLGAVAAVDLYTGDVLWETLYDQVPLPATVHWTASKRKLRWRNTAPVVVDGMVVATPLDSYDMLGIDLEHGTLVWSLPQSQLTKPSHRNYRLSLIGADESTVYLAGGSVVACRAPSGLRSRTGPKDALFGADLSVDHINPDSLGRPALGERHIVAPTPRRRIAVDRLNVRYENRMASGDWGREQSPGNVLLGDGAMFLLNSKYLTACFDWEVLESRAEERLEAAPGDDERAHALAGLLTNRGRTEFDKGQFTLAQKRLTRAREILEPRLIDSEQPVGGTQADLRALMHEVLRTEAEVLRRSRPNSTEALARLSLALDYAPTLEDQRDTLLTTAELLANLGEAERWRAVLARLEANCAHLDMPVAEGSVDAPRLAVGLWVLLARAGDDADRGAVADELEELHRVLAEYGDVPYPSADSEAAAQVATGGEQRVSQVIATVLEDHGRAVYAPFEERASALYRQAVESNDANKLGRVIELYPHADASASARDASIEAALAGGDTAKVVLLVQNSIPETWSPAQATEREAQLLVKMGVGLEHAGNRAVLDGLVGRLAPHFPALVPDAERAGGRTLAELAEAAADSSSETTEAEPSFDESARVSRPIKGTYLVLGSSPPEGDRPRLQIAARVDRRNDEILAFAATDPGRPIWTCKLEGPLAPGMGTPILLARERVVIAGRSEVLGIDTADGSVRWKWSAGRSDVQAVVGDNGVAVIVSEQERRSSMLALDATTGLELWTRPVPVGYWPTPVCGEGAAVLLPRSYSGGTGQVIDLFTGALSAGMLELAQVGERDQWAAWIADGVLILPSFPKRSPTAKTGPNVCMSARDLTSGRELWYVADDEYRDFDSIARSESGTYLIFSAGRERSGLIQQLDTRLGAVRVMTGVQIRPGDVPIGIERHAVTELHGPYLFLQSRPRESDRETIVRAIQLPYGEKWTHRLQVAPDELYNALPQPALSRSTVALAWTEPQRDRSIRPKTSLLLLDRHNGTQLDSRVLGPALGNADDLEFATLGSALVIRGRSELLFLAR